MCWVSGSWRSPPGGKKVRMGFLEEVAERKKERCALRASEVLLVVVIRSPLKLTHSQRGSQDLGSLLLPLPLIPLQPHWSPGCPMTTFSKFLPQGLGTCPSLSPGCLSDLDSQDSPRSGLCLDVPFPESLLWTPHHRSFPITPPTSASFLSVTCVLLWCHLILCAFIRLSAYYLCSTLKCKINKDRDLVNFIHCYFLVSRA